MAEVKPKYKAGDVLRVVSDPDELFFSIGALIRVIDTELACAGHYRYYYKYLTEPMDLVYDRHVLDLEKYCVLDVDYKKRNLINNEVDEWLK